MNMVLLRSSMTNARVYKGGGWKDRPYWMVPGTRRFLDQNESTNDIGFRCAMIRVGSPDRLLIIETGILIYINPVLKQMGFFICARKSDTWKISLSRSIP
jgi:hypothetical protein